MRSHPQISIIIPIYNGDRYLAECIESVLSQTFSDFELILIDDGSEDSSYSIAAGYSAIDDRILLLSQGQNLGVVNALNRGLQCASGQLIARLDQDDAALPHRLKEQALFMKEHQDVILVGSTITSINSTGEIIRNQWFFPETDCQIRFGLLFNNKIADPSVVCRAEIIGKKGLRYDPLYVGAEDYLFWANMLKYGRGYCIREPLTKYRLHDSQMSHTHAVQQARAAERISLNLLEEFDPSLKLSSIDRRLLDGMYLTFLQHYSSSPNAASIRSFYNAWCAERPESEFRRMIDQLMKQRTLQEMAGRFISRYWSKDAALHCLQRFSPDGG